MGGSFAASFLARLQIASAHDNARLLKSPIQRARSLARRTAAAISPGRRKPTTKLQQHGSTEPGRDIVSYGYAALGPIAVGAFSTVLHAESTSRHARLPAGVQVAIKTYDAAKCARALESAAARDGELKALRHACANSTLRRPHPHIANLLEECVGPAAVHAVLEYCGGGSLARYLQVLAKQKRAPLHVTDAAAVARPPQGAMAEAQARHLSRQLLSALGYLHSISIAHRDVKPANILFVDQSKDILKLCDFGFATRCGAEKLKVRCGTLLYSSPELIAVGGGAHEKGYLGAPVDIWAAGAVIFEMLHGKPAFEGHTVALVEQRIRTVRPSVPFAVSADAKAFVKALLVADAEQRADADTAQQHPWLQLAQPLREPATAASVTAFPVSCRQITCGVGATRAGLIKV